MEPGLRKRRTQGRQLTKVSSLQSMVDCFLTMGRPEVSLLKVTWTHHALFLELALRQLCPNGPPSGSDPTHRPATLTHYNRFSARNRSIASIALPRWLTVSFRSADTSARVVSNGG